MNAKKLLLVVFIAGTVVALPFVNRIVFGVNSKEVNVSTLSQRVISPSILASGYLAHEEEVMLSSEIIGKVAALFVEEGDVVVQGDLVLRVDDNVIGVGGNRIVAADSPLIVTVIIRPSVMRKPRMHEIGRRHFGIRRNRRKDLCEHLGPLPGNVTLFPMPCRIGVPESQTRRREAEKEPHRYRTRPRKVRHEAESRFGGLIR